MALNSQFILMAASAVVAVAVIALFARATKDSDPARLVDALTAEYDDLVTDSGPSRAMDVAQDIPMHSEIGSTARARVGVTSASDKERPTAR